MKAGWAAGYLHIGIDHIKLRQPGRVLTCRTGIYSVSCRKLTFAVFLEMGWVSSTLIAGVGGAGKSLMVVSRYLRSEVVVVVVQWGRKVKTLDMVCG